MKFWKESSIETSHFKVESAWFLMKWVYLCLSRYWSIFYCIQNLPFLNLIWSFLILCNKTSNKNMFVILSISDKIVLQPETMGSDPFVSILKYLQQKYLFKVNLFPFQLLAFPPKHILILIFKVSERRRILRWCSKLQNKWLRCCQRNWRPSTSSLTPLHHLNFTN